MARANPPRVYRPQKVVATFQRDARPKFAKAGVITGPADLMEAMSDYLGKRATEVFVILFVNVRNEIVGYDELTASAVAGVEVHPSGIFRSALVSGAAAIVTIHNHPTGISIPSSEDRALWQRLKAVGELVGVPVLDNLVLGESSYYSEMEGETQPLKRKDD